MEYLKALFKIGSKIEPVAVLRKGSEHDGVGSASYIRKAGIDNAKEYLPKKAYDIIMEEIQKGAAPVRQSAIDIIIVSRLMLGSIEIANIVDVGEGLENRIKKGQGFILPFGILRIMSKQNAIPIPEYAEL